MSLNTEKSKTNLAAHIALSCMDLTSLTGQESEQDIQTLCQQANTKHGNTAAICIYPQYINIAKPLLDKRVRIATVTNFPDGGENIEKAVQQTQDAVALGAHEVDVVFPYKALIAGDENIGFSLVAECKKACSDKALLKVIIESGELKTPELIKKASQLAINAGADFIKTSTGKVAINATLEAAEIMLNTIKESGSDVGFKAAGGVRTVEDAKNYIELAKNIMGESWVNSRYFRFGASGLLADVLSTLDGTTQSGFTAEGY